MGLFPKLGHSAFRPAWNRRDRAHHFNVDGPDLNPETQGEKHAWHFTVAYWFAHSCDYWVIFFRFHLIGTTKSNTLKNI